MGLLPEVANADRKIPRAAGADFFAERALFPWMKRDWRRVEG